MVMAIVLHLAGISKERYKIYIKYGHICGGAKYEKELHAFTYAFNRESEVYKCSENRQVNEPWVGSSKKCY